MNRPATRSSDVFFVLISACFSCFAKLQTVQLVWSGLLNKCCAGHTRKQNMSMDMQTVWLVLFALTGRPVPATTCVNAFYITCKQSNSF